MMTVEINKPHNAVEIYGDREGLAALVKKIMALLNKDEGSYIANGQGLERKQSKENVLADYYVIFLSTPAQEE
jgi:hypothetical protein